MKREEATIQKSIMAALGACPDVLVIDQSHVGLFEDRNGTPCRIGVTGQSDLLVIVSIPLVGLFWPVVHALEIKTATGRLSKVQKRWRDQVWGRRFPMTNYHIVRSPEEALRAVGKQDQWPRIKELLG